MAEDSLTNYAAQTASLIEQGQQFMQGERARILAQDTPAARSLADMMAPLFSGGRPLADLRNSNSLFDRVVGQAVPMLGAAGADLLGFGAQSSILATQNMFSQGGMTVRGPGGEAMPLNGYGYGAEVLATQMWDRTRADIYNPNGSIRFNNTYGATPEDIGQITQLMQQRGAFAGMQAGQMEVLSSSRLSQLRGEASQSGNTQMSRELEQLNVGDTFLSLDPGMADKVSAMRDKVVRTVQELRQVLGNLGSQEILSELERLTGVDIANPDAVRAGAGMLQSSMRAGGAAGLSAQQSLDFRAATIATMDATMSGMSGLPSGSFYRVAAGMSGAVDSFAHAAFSDQQKAGGYRTRGEVAARTSADVTALLLESPEMVESMYAASKMQDGAGKNAILESIDAYAAAGTEEARLSARRNQAALLEKHFQVRSGSLVNNIGTDNMLDAIAQQDPAMLERGAGVLARTNQAAMVGDFRRFLSMSNSDVVGQLGGLDNGARLMHGMFTGLSVEQRQQALQGNYQALNGVQMPGFGDLGQYLSSLGGGFNQALNVINSAVMDSPSMGPLLTGPGAKSAAQARASHDLTNINTRGQTNLSWKQRFAQGLLGGEVNEDDTRMVDYALGLEDDPSTQKGSWVARYKVNSGLGLDVTAAGAGDLAKQLAGAGDKGSNLYSMFGISHKDPDKDAKLAAKLGGAGALERVTGALGKDPEQILQLNPDGENASLDIIKNPAQLRERLNQDLKEIRAGSTIDKAAQAGANMQSRQPVQVTFNITTPTGPSQLVGTMVT